MVTAQAKRAFAQDIVYLGHKNALKTHLTVEENLQFWAHLYGGDVMMPMVCHWWGLHPVLDEQVGNLSQGWQRRVALARLMFCKGRLWILDEPTANLDFEGKEMFERLMESRRAQGGTVIFSCHMDVQIPKLIELDVEDFQPIAPAYRPQMLTSTCPLPPKKRRSSPLCRGWRLMQWWWSFLLFQLRIAMKKRQWIGISLAYQAWWQVFSLLP